MPKRRKSSGISEHQKKGTKDKRREEVEQANESTKAGGNLAAGDGAGQVAGGSVAAGQVAGEVAKEVAGGRVTAVNVTRGEVAGEVVGGRVAAVDVAGGDVAGEVVAPSPLMLTRRMMI